MTGFCLGLFLLVVSCLAVLISRRGELRSLRECCRSRSLSDATSLEPGDRWLGIGQEAVRPQRSLTVISSAHSFDALRYATWEWATGPNCKVPMQIGNKSRFDTRCIRHVVPDPPCNVPGNRSRVFFIGLHKTGTTTIASILRSLSVRTLHAVYWMEVFLSGNSSKALRGQLLNVGKFQAYTDGGMNHYTWQRQFEFGGARMFNPRYLDHCCPGSLFVLTVRPLLSWIISAVHHIVRNKLSRPDGSGEGERLMWSDYVCETEADSLRIWPQLKGWIIFRDLYHRRVIDYAMANEAFAERFEIMSLIEDGAGDVRCALCKFFMRTRRVVKLRSGNGNTCCNREYRDRDTIHENRDKLDPFHRTANLTECIVAGTYAALQHILRAPVVPSRYLEQSLLVLPPWSARMLNWLNVSGHQRWMPF